MIPDQLDPLLLWVAAGHLGVALVCLAALARKATPILGVHPALKPMKFGVSIASFLATMAVMVPALAVPGSLRRGLAWTLAVTMILEMVPILVQAVRGTTSHFNVARRLDALLWQLMAIAIVAATGAMLVIVLAASLRPLELAPGQPMTQFAATAWRAGLWLLLVAPISGFAMGGRGRHSVGGDDGGAGLPLVGWSRRHGDLRVSHFFALHALQLIPLAGGLLAALPLADSARWIALVLVIGLYAFVTVATLVQALAARPIW